MDLRSRATVHVTRFVRHLRLDPTGTADLIKSIRPCRGEDPWCLLCITLSLFRLVSDPFAETHTRRELPRRRFFARPPRALRARRSVQRNAREEFPFVWSPGEGSEHRNSNDNVVKSQPIKRAHVETKIVPQYFLKRLRRRVSGESSETFGGGGGGRGRGRGHGGTREGAVRLWCTCLKDGARG